MIGIRPHLEGIRRWREYDHDPGPHVRLDLNERVPALPDGLFREILDTLTPETFSQYPDVGPLITRLARETGVSREWVYPTNGSDSAIRLIFRAFVDRGDRVVLPDPTYAMYRIHAAISQASVADVPYRADLTLDVDALAALIATKPRLVALALPDQPTGFVLSAARLREIVAAAHRHGVLLLIDEAYYPFYPETAAVLVRDFDNVAITRSFSKAAGVAGLRLGYVIANPALIEGIDKVRGAFEVNGVAVAVGCYVLDHPEIAAGYLREVEEGRSVLLEAARALGFGIVDCPTNFQLLRAPDGVDPKALTRALRAHGYAVKTDFAAPLDRYLRITVGAPSVMHGCAVALRAAVSEALR